MLNSATTLGTLVLCYITPPHLSASASNLFTMPLGLGNSYVLILCPSAARTRPSTIRFLKSGLPKRAADTNDQQNVIHVPHRGLKRQ